MQHRSIRAMPRQGFSTGAATRGEKMQLGGRQKLASSWCAVGLPGRVLGLRWQMVRVQRLIWPLAACGAANATMIDLFGAALHSECDEGQHNSGYGLHSFAYGGRT